MQRHRQLPSLLRFVMIGAYGVGAACLALLAACGGSTTAQVADGSIAPGPGPDAHDPGGADEGCGGHDPARYIAAWRRIHDRFVAAGATNVVWVWAPNVTDVEGGPETMAYYPGDAYVDWTGVDGYNWGTSDPSFAWQSFKEV